MTNAASAIRSLGCDVLAVAGAGVFGYGLYSAWAPLGLCFAGGITFWFAFVLRGRTR